MAESALSCHKVRERTDILVNGPRGGGGGGGEKEKRNHPTVQNGGVGSIKDCPNCNSNY